MKKRPVRRRIPAIRRAQAAYNEHRVCELIMDLDAALKFIGAISEAYLEMVKTRSPVVIHFLSLKSNVPSAFISEVHVQRLNIMVDMIVEDVHATEISQDDAQHQLIDFLNKLSDI